MTAAQAKRVRNEKGFTLMEMAISLGIFSLVLVSSVHVLSEAHKLSQQSRERLLALTAVRSTLETIKNTPLTAIGGVAATANANFIPAGLQNAAITINTNPGAINANTPSAVVTVRLTWTGPNNIQRILEISTMRSRF